MNRVLRLPLVVLALAAGDAGHAGTPGCRDLHVPTFDHPTGQVASATLGPFKRVPPPTRHVPVPSGPTASVTITLERSECLGTCPSYTVVIHGDGSASYDGRSFVLVPGHRDFTVSRAAVDCLLAAFRKADFWSLSNYSEMNITDGPYYHVTLAIGGESKSVSDYFGSAVGMPLIVTALEDEIDRVAADRWVKGTEETLPSLRKEGFDFHSPAAATMLAAGAATAPEALLMGMLDAGTAATGRVAQPFPLAPSGETAVEAASHAGRTAIVEAMIAKGALSDAPPEVKNSVLRDAAATGDPRFVAAVLAAKPDVDAQNSEGYTALAVVWCARRYAKDQAKVDPPAVTRLLLAAGADPNIADKNGRTALFYASDAETVKLLVAADAKLETRDKYGRTPLLEADTDAIAAALIEAGADTRARGLKGETVTAMAESKRFAATLRLLRAKRSKPRFAP